MSAAEDPPAVECRGITKDYGHVRALDGLHLEVPQGQVFGLLGPNGAGKTTAIRVLLDVVRPKKGSARVLGHDAQEETAAVHERVGYLPSEPSFQGGLTAAEQLSFLADLRGGVSEHRWRSLAERLDLDLDRPVGELSRGNVQKVGLVQAFMHDPEVLILDEPTTGLDPILQETFHEMVAETVEADRTVFLSSHVVSQVERMAETVGVLRNGELVTEADVDALKSQAHREVGVHFVERPSVPVLEMIPGVRDVAVNGDHAWFRIEGHLDPLVKTLADHEVVNITSREPDLETVFRGFYEET